MADLFRCSCSARCWAFRCPPVRACRSRCYKPESHSNRDAEAGQHRRSGIWLKRIFFLYQVGLGRWGSKASFSEHVPTKLVEPGWAWLCCFVCYLVTVFVCFLWFCSFCYIKYFYLLDSKIYVQSGAEWRWLLPPAPLRGPKRYMQGKLEYLYCP